MRQQAAASGGTATVRTSSTEQEVGISSADQDQDQVDGAANKKIKFRNYQPYDSTLKALNSAGEASIAPSNNADSSKEIPASRSTIELPPSATATKLPRQPLDIIKAELEQLEGVETNIVPKKINWDLKEQVAGKLDKLKRRTQRAIVDILKEKIAAEEGDLD